jgi:S1-C subfamily serine protease
MIFSQSKESKKPALSSAAYLRFSALCERFFFAFTYSLFFFLAQCQPQSTELTQETLEEAKDRAVTIYHESNMVKGSGFLINDQGYVLTAFHVVGVEPVIRVSQDDENFYEAKVVFKEIKFDIALLETTLKKKISRLEWWGKQGIAINDSIFSIASPLGLTRSFLKGYISETERIKFDPQYPEINYIQTYGTSFEGSSGAAVYLYNGKIIGMNRATFGTSYGNSFGLVLPTEFIHVFMDQLDRKIEYR